MELGPILSIKQRNWYFSGFFFHILLEVYIYKLKVVVIEIPEWKLKTKLARNTILKEIKTKYLPILGQKEQKVNILEDFALVSQSLSLIIGINIASVFLIKGLKIEILLKEFCILAFLGPKCGPMLGQKWQKRLFSCQPPHSQPSFS